MLSATTSSSSSVRAFSAWTETQIKENQAISLSQRAKLLSEPGVLKKRPIIINAERWDDNDDIENDDSINSYTNDDDDTKLISSKVIHFQRHGQGYHNLLYRVLIDSGMKPDVDSTDPIINPLLRKELVDSPLTEYGKDQCAYQKPIASQLNPELVVVSPLLRAIQTAEITFEDFSNHPYHNLNNNNRNNNKEIPWIAHEGCREELGLLVCNKRRPLSHIQKDYPHIDYSLMTGEDDALFDPNKRETNESKSDRIYDFLVDFIARRPEKEIAVVGHSAWLFHMCNAIVDCNHDDMLQSWFLTSEVRSMKLTFLQRKEQ